jgi:MOSC domain-containing protein YiiM
VVNDPDTFGPRGDPSRHLRLVDLEESLRATRAPLDTGRVELIVRRRADNARETPIAIDLTVDAGVPGDAWGRRPDPNPAQQLAVMQVNVGRLIANGQPLTLFGDNLFFDLDLSAANLPIGSRLRAGAVLLEVTPHPHNGCHKFAARFGQDALRLVANPVTRRLNLRGVYMRVVEPGHIACGDEVRVLSRAAAPQT